MTFLYLILALRDKSRNKSTDKLALLSFIKIRLFTEDTIGTFVPVPYNSPLQEGIASHIFTPVRCLITSFDLQGKRLMNLD